jgi:hypothetical protein
MDGDSFIIERREISFSLSIEVKEEEGFKKSKGKHKKE